MKIVIWLLRILIPMIVLYTIGYYVPGFSALTIPWIVLLTVLILAGDWVAARIMGQRTGRFGRGLISFLVATVIIFTVTLAIEGGSVPLGGALLAAAIIAVLFALLDVRDVKRRI